jgi:hypothetical protein
VCRFSAASPLGSPFSRPGRLLLRDGLRLVAGAGDHRGQVKKVDRQFVDLRGGPPVPFGEPGVFG